MTRPCLRAAAALVVLLAAPSCIAAARLPKDTVVRVQASGIEPGWHAGRIGVAKNGCTMVYLDTKARGGYTSVSLRGAARLERKDGSGWVDVPVKPLLQAEPRECREGGDND
jgi:hypothetical protein